MLKSPLELVSSSSIDKFAQNSLELINSIQFDWSLFSICYIKESNLAARSVHSSVGSTKSVVGYGEAEDSETHMLGLHQKTFLEQLGQK